MPLFKLLVKYKESDNCSDCVLKHIFIILPDSDPASMKFLTTEVYTEYWQIATGLCSEEKQEPEYFRQVSIKVVPVLQTRDASTYTV